MPLAWAISFCAVATRRLVSAWLRWWTASCRWHLRSPLPARSLPPRARPPSAPPGRRSRRGAVARKRRCSRRSSLASSDLGLPWIGAARSVTFSRNSGAAGSHGASSLTSTYNGSAGSDTGLRQHRQRRVRAVRVKPSRGFVPGEAPTGHDEQQVVGSAALQPVRDFLVDPGRGDRVGGQHHDQVAGAVHGFGDLAPQIGAGRQIGGVAKHPQRGQLAQPPADAVQTALDPVSDRSIIVVVGDEGVVRERLLFCALVELRRVGPHWKPPNPDGIASRRRLDPLDPSTRCDEIMRRIGCHCIAVRGSRASRLTGQWELAARVARCRRSPQNVPPRTWSWQPFA